MKSRQKSPVGHRGEVLGEELGLVGGRPEATGAHGASEALAGHDQLPRERRELRPGDGGGPAARSAGEDDEECRERAQKGLLNSPYVSSFAMFSIDDRGII